ncbi:DUF11 domain-containing protein [Candidatus Saccharibacteria bacterium]|nr:DUF11 domain-containing protein [Candidatus Saccharibacteria bacterium]
MKVTNFMRNVSKRTYAVAAMALAAVVVPATLFAWGPTRATFTIAHPATYVTFNSITDNPNIGDERNFVGIRENNTSGLWQDSQAVQPGKEYVVRMYVHNNASANLGLVAQNVTASFNLPTTTAKSIQVQGFLRATNANPAEVYDHANFTASENFNLAVVPGSIKYYNNANGNGFSIPETVFTNSGAKLGYDKMDGNIPGCFQYDGYLTFIVKPQFAATPDFTMSKLVSKHGENKWVDTYAAQPGETVDYLLQYKNTGTTQQDNVTFHDKLPTNMTYVAGSTTYGNAKNPNGLKASDNITGAGINVGSYAPGANAWVIFSAKVAAKDALACGANTLHNVASVTPAGQNPKEDSADVTTTKDCAPEKVKACNTATGKIEEVEKGKENTAPYTTDLSKCAPKPEMVKACNTKTGQIEMVEKGKENTAPYTTDLSKCAPKPELVTACNLKTKKIEYNVDKSKIDNVNYTLDLDKCKETPKPEEIQVCRLDDKKVVVISKDEYNAHKDKYSTVLNDCASKPEMCPIPGKEMLPKDSADCKQASTVPAELPETGLGDSLVQLLGAGSMVGMASAFVASRRAMKQN